MKAHILLSTVSFLGMFLIIFSNCSERTSTSSVAPSLKKMYKDSVFLEIKGDLNDPEVIWAKADIYLQAFQRILKHSRIKNNQIIFDFKAPDEIKISPEIYNYVFEAFEFMNKKAKEKRLRIIKEDQGYKYFHSPENRETSLNNRGNLLIKGNHLANFKILSALIIKEVSGNLNDIIDFSASGFEGNGMGDISISGAYDPSQYIKPTDGYQSLAGYYCSNACAFSMKGDGCYDNEILDIRHGPDGPPVDYVKILNNK